MINSLRLAGLFLESDLFRFGLHDYFKSTWWLILEKEISSKKYNFLKILKISVFTCFDFENKNIGVGFRYNCFEAQWIYATFNFSKISLWFENFKIKILVNWFLLATFCYRLYWSVVKRWGFLDFKKYFYKKFVPLQLFILSNKFWTKWQQKCQTY